MRNCPVCGSPSSLVLDSRHTPQSTRRRRECTKCNERWTTYEVSAAAFNALTDLDAALSAATKGMREAAENMARLREDARQIRDDYGITEYRPVRDGRQQPERRPTSPRP